MATSTPPSSIAASPGSSRPTSSAPSSAASSAISRYDPRARKVQQPLDRAAPGGDVPVKPYADFFFAAGFLPKRFVHERFAALRRLALLIFAAFLLQAASFCARASPRPSSRLLAAPGGRRGR